MAIIHFLTAVLSVLVYCTIGVHLAVSSSVQGVSCKNHPCPTGQECFLKNVSCSNPPCPLIPSCRTSCAVIFCESGTYCINGKCVTSCDEVDCGPGQECHLESKECTTAPCPPPKPVCRPSCEVIRCKNGTYCINGKCVTSCDEVNCGPGKQCVLEDVACFVPPCPCFPTCKPVVDKCAAVRCREGYECYNGECFKKPTCEGHKCGADEECYLQDVQCIRAPCFPIPACRPLLTCATINCIEGYICVDRKCIPKPSCEGYYCGPGQECHLESKECTIAPCPPPKPVCRPSCEVIRCPSGTYCINGKCVTSCDEVKCGPGEQCVLEDVACFAPPCTPFPTCKPIVDKCAIVRCRGGYECYDGKCFKRPTCEGHKCGADEECYLQDVQCIRAPCFPIPACRPLLTCATINCIEGYICVDRKCIPKPSCEGYYCGPGQECHLESKECTIAPCPPPKPVCRPSCEVIRCPSGTYCINGKCVTSCDEVKCGPGEQCVLEDVACFAPPCTPFPTCKPIVDKCAIVRCRGGYECYDGKCFKRPTCEGHKCGPDEECYLQDVQCIRAPCFPVPACRPLLTCATIKCPSGYTCKDNKCIPPRTCKDFYCEPGQECHLESKKCTTAPCPPPEPACRPSCALILCKAPSNCFNGQCFPITN